MSPVVTAPAPAIGYSVVANLAGDRQVTAQCFVAEDETEAAINAKFDRVFRVIDRQKSRYELVDIRKELHKLRETLAQFEEDLGRADLEFDKAQASLDEQAKTLTEDRQEAFQTGYDEHVNSGRRGEYQPKGTTLATMRTHDVALSQVKDQKEKNEAERNQHRQQILISVERYKKAIASAEADIAERESLFAVPDAADG